jgi:hypothetical protein
MPVLELSSEGSPPDELELVSASEVVEASSSAALLESSALLELAPAELELLPAPAGVTSDPQASTGTTIATRTGVRSMSNLTGCFSPRGW